MKTTRASLVVSVVTILLATASASDAQDAPRPGGAALDAAGARARAASFLRDGPRAPRPDLRPDDLEELVAVEVEDHLHGPAFDLLLKTAGGRLRLVVRVERAQGRVLYFSQPERDTIVLRHRDDRTRRPQAELDEETRLRARLDRAALRARAVEFVGHLVPEAIDTGSGPARRFEVVHESSERDGLLVDAFVLMEAPAAGVLACFRNIVQVDVSPETGDVVSMRRTDLRHDVRAAPPVDADAATRAARAHLKPRATSAEPSRAPKLEVLPAGEPGRFRSVWLVAFPPDAAGAEPRVCLVGADDGRVRESR